MYINALNDVRFFRDYEEALKKKTTSEKRAKSHRLSDMSTLMFYFLLNIGQ